MLTTGSPKLIGWWLSLVEIATWFGFSIGLASAVLLAPLSGRRTVVLGYLGWMVVTAWARSVHVLTVRGCGRWWRNGVAFLISPLYGVLSLFVLLPLRVYSLLGSEGPVPGPRVHQQRTQICKADHYSSGGPGHDHQSPCPWPCLGAWLAGSMP